MQESIEYDAALAAGLLILELFDSSPGASKPELLSSVVFIVTHAMQESRRLLAEAKPPLEPSLN